MTVPTDSPLPVPNTECTSCTVPIATGGLCSFCQTYVPPATVAQKIDILVNKVDIVRHDLNEVYRGLSDAAPLLTVADIVTAACHLRQAAVILDRASDALEADAKVVGR